jgi:hypothetical protein
MTLAVKPDEFPHPNRYLGRMFTVPTLANRSQRPVGQSDIYKKKEQEQKSETR